MSIASVPVERVDRILDAAYACFARHGFRKTTMEDIAAAAGMSRPAVYQYVRSKQDAFGRLRKRLFERALTEARIGAEADGTLAQRMDRILVAKLSVTQELWRDGPYAAELLTGPGGGAVDQDRQFVAELSDLLTATISAAAAEADLRLPAANAREVAELALALTRGLEADLSDADRPRERLRSGVALLVAGLAAASKARDNST